MDSQQGDGDLTTVVAAVHVGKELGGCGGCGQGGVHVSTGRGGMEWWAKDHSTRLTGWGASSLCAAWS